MKDRIELHGYFDPDACDVAEFEAIVSRRTDPEDVPQASEIIANIPAYDMAAADLADRAARRALMAEWAAVLHRGAGAVVLRGVYADTSVLDRATDVFMDIIAAEKAGRGGGADHFAAAGANDRVWNAQEKLCLAAPEVFVRYFGQPALDAMCEAWLGRGYQMTSQVNLVRPGGAAQEAHRDYHLGFMTQAQAAGFPAHMHLLSPMLTLQGAVAHCDMSVESGPTQLLPFSQCYEAGYVAFHRDDFRAVFAARSVQVALQKGDALFFSPALFHAAGENRTADVQRFANLLQVSSPLWLARELVVRRAMCRAIYPYLHGLNRLAQEAAIAAAAEGYAFPTSLDTDPPVGGLAPETDAQIVRQALRDGLDVAALGAALEAAEAKRG